MKDSSAGKRFPDLEIVSTGTEEKALKFHRDVSLLGDISQHRRGKDLDRGASCTVFTVKAFQKQPSELTINYDHMDEVTDTP